MDMSIRTKSGAPGTGQSEPILPGIAGMSGWHLYAHAGITVRDMPYIVRHLHAPSQLLRLFREIPSTATLSPRRRPLSLSHGLVKWGLSDGHEATQIIPSSSSTPRLRGGGRGKRRLEGGRACVDPLPRPTGANPGQPHLIPDNTRQIPDTASCVVRDLPTLSGIVSRSDPEPVEWAAIPEFSESRHSTLTQ